MDQARMNSAAMQKAAELPAHLETFEAKTANDFSNSTIPMISSRAVRTPQLAARRQVPKTGKNEKIKVCKNTATGAVLKWLCFGKMVP